MLRFLWLIGVGFAIVWIASALLPVEHGQEAISVFGKEFLDRASSRATLSYLASGLGTLWAFFVMWQMFRSGLVGRFLQGVPRPASALLAGALIGIAASVLLLLAGFPFRAFGFMLERRYGLTEATFWIWLSYYLKGAAMSILAYAGMGAVVGWALWVHPKGWPWFLGGGFVLVSAFFTFIYPSTIAPMLDRFYPLEDPVLAEEIALLAERAEIDVGQVLVMEASRRTSRVNAYFAGFGSQKQVVLYDTLIDTHSPEEVRLVLAHEMGHWKHGHVSKGLILSTLGVFVIMAVFVGAGGTVPIHDWRGLEGNLLLLLVIATLLNYSLSPIACAVSRRWEVEADAFSLDLTQDPDTFIATQVALARGNLSDVEPPAFMKWFASTHPATLERIGAAKAWRPPS